MHVYIYTYVYIYIYNMYIYIYIYVYIYIYIYHLLLPRLYWLMLQLLSPRPIGDIGRGMVCLGAAVTR